MDITELTNEQLTAAAGAIGFIAGGLLVWLFAKPRRRDASSEDPRNHKIRGLEADSRSTNRRLNEISVALEEKTAEFNTAVATLQEVRTKFAANEAELVVAKSELKAAVKKTRELRVELQDRATQTVREQVRAVEAETELEVARAGSDAVLGEITRLQQERRQLTDSMRILGDQFLLDERMLKVDD